MCFQLLALILLLWSLYLSERLARVGVSEHVMAPGVCMTQIHFDDLLADFEHIETRIFVL